jgi:hypothetical protein
MRIGGKGGKKFKAGDSLPILLFLVVSLFDFFATTG